MNKHEQEIAELISKHEQAVLELRAGHDVMMMMRSELVQRHRADEDVNTVLDTSTVVPTCSTDSVYMKTKPSPWVRDVVSVIV